MQGEDERLQIQSSVLSATSPLGPRGFALLIILGYFDMETLHLILAIPRIVLMGMSGQKRTHIGFVTRITEVKEREEAVETGGPDRVAPVIDLINDDDTQPSFLTNQFRSFFCPTFWNAMDLNVSCATRKLTQVISILILSLPLWITLFLCQEEALIRGKTYNRHI